MTIDARETRLKRLRLRSMRRGIKEMDLILGRFAEDHLADLDDTGLDLYETMLSENDHDLYQWVSGQKPAPQRYASLLALISTRIGKGIATGRGA